jgi:hypothetical protein
MQRLDGHVRLKQQQLMTSYLMIMVESLSPLSQSAGQISTLLKLDIENKPSVLVVI